MRRFDPSNVLAQILVEKSGWLEPLAECKISDVCVSAVITCNVIDSPTLMFFRCLVFRVNYHRRSVFEALWYRCILCDLKTLPSCSDSPATYGSPNMCSLF